MTSVRYPSPMRPLKKRATLHIGCLLSSINSASLGTRVLVYRWDEVLSVTGIFRTKFDSKW